MNQRVKKTTAIGCAVLGVALLALAGAATWYAREIGHDYKALRKSEKALIDTLGEPASFVPPSDQRVRAEDVQAFVAVRRAGAEWRQLVIRDLEDFAKARGRRGVAGVWKTFAAGNDLAQGFAGFWQNRNEALLAQGVGPGKYAWLYGLIYYGWLGHDPDAGRIDDEAMPHGSVPPGMARWRAVHDAGGPSAATVAVLAPHRHALEDLWMEATNPVELIFEAEVWSGKKERP